MKNVRAKKQLGQHFLNNEGIASKIVAALSNETAYQHVLEIGPGMGVLSDLLFKREDFETTLVDLDQESIRYLLLKYPEKAAYILEADFLRQDWVSYFKQQPFAIIGNFPYNISTQILFSIYEMYQQVDEMVGMFQKEVAERLVSPPGSKVYGITSVLLQTYYDAEYLFTVDEHEFSPPPKVKSAVVRLKRNQRKELECDAKRFKSIVKMAFNQRRKTLRNSLKSILPDHLRSHERMGLRPEQLDVESFIWLCQEITSV